MSAGAIINSKSTERAAQVRKLFALLKIRPHHTYELRRLGISHPAGRVQDLEAEGHLIHSARVVVVDEHGFTHPGVALYSLVDQAGDTEMPAPIAAALSEGDE
jgi:hypothetical protein